jgi:hypothetical protein
VSGLSSCPLKKCLFIHFFRSDKRDIQDKSDKPDKCPTTVQAKKRPLCPNWTGGGKHLKSEWDVLAIGVLADDLGTAFLLVLELSVP